MSLFKTVFGPYFRQHIWNGSRVRLGLLEIILALSLHYNTSQVLFYTSHLLRRGLSKLASCVPLNNTTIDSAPALYHLHNNLTFTRNLFPFALYLLASADAWDAQAKFILYLFQQTRSLMLDYLCYSFPVTSPSFPLHYNYTEKCNTCFPLWINFIGSIIIIP